VRPYCIWIAQRLLIGISGAIPFFHKAIIDRAQNFCLVKCVFLIQYLKNVMQIRVEGIASLHMLDRKPWSSD
jgi:hypothetical protein